MRIYLSSDINQEQKKQHLISNIFHIANEIDGIIPEGFNRCEFRNVLRSMTELDLINLNCKLLNRITPDVEIKKPSGLYKIKYTDGSISKEVTYATTLRHRKKFIVAQIIKL